MPDDEGATPLPTEGLAAPARRALSDAGYSTLEQLAEVDEGTVGELHGMGPSALKTLREALETHGLSFSEVK